MRIDEVDVRILRLLQENATTSKAEIAREVDLAASAVFARIARLEEAGVIRGYHAALDPGKLGYSHDAFVFIHERKPAAGKATLEALAALGIAEELHRITGEDCYLLRVRARDTDDLRATLDKIGTVENVSGVRTHLVLQSVRGTPLAVASEE